MDDAFAVLQRDVDQVILYIPRLVGALVILAFGCAVAWLACRLITGILERVGFDRLAHRTGLIHDLERIGVRSRPSHVFGNVVFAIIVLAVATQAADTLQFAPIASAMRMLLTFTPHFIVAIIVLFAGVIVADMLAGAVAAAMSRSGVLYHGPAAAMVRGTITILAILMALQQLTIESRFLLDVLLVVLAGGALMVGIAGGWGARTVAENLLSARYLEHHINVGDDVTVGDIQGTVVGLDSTSTSVRSADGTRFLIPNGTLAKETIRFHSAPASEPES